MKVPINPATHSWRSAGYKLEACCLCKKQTTGRLTLAVGIRRAERALCSDCAVVKGFTR